MKPTLIRITTVPMALKYLLPGQMHYMQSHGMEVLMISADGKELADVLAQEQCPHRIVPMTRQITPLQDLKCLWQLIRLFKKVKPSIVHTHTPKAGLLGMLAAKITGVPIRIHTVAGLPLLVEKGFKFQLLKWVEKITYAAANKVWPNSNSLLQIIKAQALTADKKLQVIGKGSSNGIDTARFNKTALNHETMDRIKASIQYNPSYTYLLCIGRLVTDKGIPELVEVFSQLQSRLPNIRLLLVGSFEETLDPLPLDTINQINNNPGIVHIGWTDKVEYYLQMAQYFVFPSHREGFPNVLLQAAAMELPITCSDIEGNSDIVQNQVTGLLFEKGNSQQLLQQLEFALANPNRMTEMAAQLYQIVQSDYQRENIWKNILKEYQTLLNLKH